MLPEIFEEQKKLNNRIVTGLYQQIEEEGIKRYWFLENMRALQQETCEAIDSVAWKWWKKQDDNWNNAKIELVDILHFLVSGFTILGMDAQEVFNLYMKKNELNHQRQVSGYKDGTYLKI
jgi:dimeric dUTPase (all-alpha-NTP-PPase superfamily)